MRHITSEGLDRLAPLLDALRGLPELKEKSHGVFYRKSKAFLHFHEDPAGFFADVRLAGPGTDFERMRVSTKAEQRTFLTAVRRALTA